MKLPEVTGQRPIPGFAGALQAPQGGAVEKATANLGASIVGLGEAMARGKIKDDKFKVEDATTRLQQSVVDLSKGDNGYTGVKSGNISNTFHKEYIDRFEDARKEISDSLGNDEQKEMFERRAELSRVGYGENLINHITKENNAFNEQVYTGGIATELDLASSDYDNENEVKRALLRTRKLTEAEADRRGLKGDIRKTLIKENESTVHESVIRQAVDDGNHQYAKDWFKKNQKNILGDRQDEVKKLLRASGIKEDSQAAVDDYVGRDLSESEAKAEARKLDPDVRDATIQRISARYGEANQILDREQKALGEQAWSIYADTGDVDDIPISVLEGMDGRERVALESTDAKAKSGTDVKTDPKTYYVLRQMAAEDPAAFKKENLLKYTHLLSPADRKEMVKLQTDDKGIAVARTKTQIMKQGAISAGVSKGQVKQGYGDEIEAYQQRVDSELEVFQITTGKEPTPKDILDITDRLNIEVLRDPEGFWGTGFFKGDRPAISAEVEGVPQDLIDDLAASLERQKLPVTDENIQILYKATLR